MIRVDDYDFDLPEELIAQTPLKERDKSRLMVDVMPMYQMDIILQYLKVTMI